MPRKGCYVDNARNRSLGRVGKAYGTAVVKSSSSRASAESSYAGYSYGGGRSSSSSYSEGSSQLSTRTYIDNTANRRLGRVGKPVGTHVVSSKDGSVSASRSTTTSSSTKIYADNSTNRALGRAGMPHGTCVQHKDGSLSRSATTGACSTSCTKTYVDNPTNRALGRVGKPVGTHVVSKDGSVSASRSTTTSSSTKTYADNSTNRALGRVGMPHGTCVQHKDGSLSRSATTGACSTSCTKTYVDNPTNRALGRVGLPYGTYVQHKDGSESGHRVFSKTGAYADNALNRKLGRVGKQLGAYMPHTNYSTSVSSEVVPAVADTRHTPKPRKAASKHELEQLLVSEQNLEEIIQILHAMDFTDPDRTAVQSAQYELQRHQAEETWDKQGIKLEYPRTEEAEKEIIPLSEITVQEQIGSGGFGEVFAGVWKHTRIAYKKFLCQQITNKKKKQIVNEIVIFSRLRHPNIVQMFGVVVEERNFGIIMEYLSKTLFHALFVEEIAFGCAQKKKLVEEVISAVQHLHDADIAHCDLKCQNVLLDFNGVAKLCDFGLSAVKTSMASISTALAAPGQGTPRYSAPEVLRGELLELAGLKKADIYSLSLVIYQVLVEEDPFEDLTMLQLTENVGRGDKRPDLKTLADSLKDILTKAWDKLPAQRPEVQELSKMWDRVPIAHLNC